MCVTGNGNAERERERERERSRTERDESIEGRRDADMKREIKEGRDK